uniref:neurabin-1-like isoform X2 n=1 Tax=Myxine glutinosa TaxID=7769 RepID=UPI00358DDBC8
MLQVDVAGDGAVFEDVTQQVVSWSSPSGSDQGSDRVDKDSINQGPNVKRIKNMLFTETYPVVSRTSKFSFNSESNREESVAGERKLPCISGNVSEVRRKFERCFTTPSISRAQIAKLSSSDPNLLNAHQGNGTEHARRTLSHSGESGMTHVLGADAHRNHQSSSSLSCLWSPALSQSRTKARVNSGPMSKRLSSFLLDDDVDEVRDEDVSLLSSFAKTSSISSLKSDELADANSSLLKFSYSPLKGTDDATRDFSFSQSKGDKRHKDGWCLKDFPNPALPRRSPIEGDVVCSNIATVMLKAELVTIESDSPRSDESMPIKEDENGVGCEALEEPDTGGLQVHEEKERCDDHPFEEEHVGMDCSDSESYENLGKLQVHCEEEEMITSRDNPLKGIENAAFDDQLVGNGQSGAEESTEVFEGRSIGADVGNYETLPGLSSDEERGSNCKVRFSSSPIKVFVMHSKEEYDRSNDEVDPIAASAEYEIEKRVEQMVVFPVELNKDEHGLGISIIGMGVAVDTEDEKLGIFVKSVVEGGAAHRDGRIKVNDQIVEVNGVSLVGVTQSFASETLRNNSGKVRFLFGRDEPGQTDELARLLQTVQGEKRQEELLKARHLSQESDGENRRHRIAQASSEEDDEGTSACTGNGTERAFCDSGSNEEVFSPLDWEPSQLSLQYQELRSKHEATQAELEKLKSEVCVSEREWQAWDGERSLLSAALLEERSLTEDLHFHYEEAREECHKLNQMLQEALAVKEDLGHRYQRLLTSLPPEARGQQTDLLEDDGVKAHEFNYCAKQLQQHESKMPVVNVTHSATLEQSSLPQMCRGGSTHDEISSANVIEAPKVVDDLFIDLIQQTTMLDSSIQKTKRQLLGKNKRRKPSRTSSSLVYTSTTLNAVSTLEVMSKALKEEEIVMNTGAIPKTNSSSPAREIEMPTEEPSVESVQPSERSAPPAAQERLSFGKGTLKFLRAPLRRSLGKGKSNNMHLSSSKKKSQDSKRIVSDWARERNGPRSNTLSACLPRSRRNSDDCTNNGLSNSLPGVDRPQTSLATGQMSEAGRGEEQLYGMITEPNTSGYSHTFVVNSEVDRGYMEGPSPTRPHHWQNRAVHEWGPEQVNQWLLVLGLERYAESFSLHDVHGDQLLQLDGSKLKALGVTDAEDRTLIKRRLKDLRTTLVKERKARVKLERQRAKEHNLNQSATSDGSQDNAI